VGTAIGVGVGVGEALGVGAGVAATLKHIGCESPVECVTVNAMTAARTIQVRPSQNPRWKKQGGWEVLEADSVSPVYCGPNAREQALSYAHQRVWAMDALRSASQAKPATITIADSLLLV
jgi:hypothetical protein